MQAAPYAYVKMHFTEPSKFPKIFTICCQFIPTSVFINYIIAAALMPSTSLQRNNFHQLHKICNNIRKYVMDVLFW